MSQEAHTPEIAVLKQTMLFAGLGDEDLDWLLANAVRVTLAPGDLLMAEGSLPDAFYVALEGEFEILKRVGDQNVLLARRVSGDILGEMSLIENAPRGATVRAAGYSTALCISGEVFDGLLCGNPTTAKVLLRTVIARLRNTESMLGQQEKLAALGKLAAGLAHELNNPAAAARRSADQLRQTIAAWLDAHNELTALRLAPAVNQSVLSRLQRDLARNPQLDLPPSLLEGSDWESAIEAWLGDRGMEDAWKCAPALVSFGWNPSTLAAWCAPFSQDQVAPIVRWLAAGYTVHSLLGEVSESSKRISEIVAAVKDYTYLDQAPKKAIDVHMGLESTLVILSHKLKQGVAVQRDYDRSLPHIEAYASELNQVWTNLIDNAIDAMRGHGELRISTGRENEWVVVTIADNGPGIPIDVLPRVFEPFFTTKQPGSGTGLGLYISYNIVQKHRGKIEVHSQPGATQFIVSLPTQLSALPE